MYEKHCHHRLKRRCRVAGELFHSAPGTGDSAAASGNGAIGSIRGRSVPRPAPAVPPPHRGEVMVLAKEGRGGFTLIELSIVLVIIGFIVGGVLVGQTLIEAAAVRAQITQIEKFNTATNTFYGKYGYLPGDIPAGPAAQFGFAARGQYAGQGDGNGVIEGNCYGGIPNNTGTTQSAGETAMFWVDLSAANLIEGQFNTATSNASNCSANISGAALNAWFPQAKIGQGSYVLVMGGTGGNVGYMNFSAAGPNFFEVEGVTLLGNGFNGTVNPTSQMTVQQAYSIDNKIDDGLPTSGNVLAIALNTSASWAGISPTNLTQQWYPEPGRCYDNGGVAGATLLYSISTYPNLVACPLAFKFQ
jgi:prepilin-type N-terminal cleavage/methylation domain-containing protein